MRNLLFAKNQQRKITLSQFDQSAHCWKQCTSHSLTSKLMTYEKREDPAEESQMQTHSLSPNPNERERQN